MSSVMAKGPLSPRELALLLLEWPIKQSPRLALPLCILFAGIVQLGTIYLFSISYKAPSEPPPAAPQIYFLPPDSTEARQLAPWLEANDPAVFSPIRVAHEALPLPPPLKYRPSYEEPPPPLIPLPPIVSVAMEPPALPLLGGIYGRHFSHAKPASPRQLAAPVRPPTTVQWQDGLAGKISSETQIVSPPMVASPLAQPALYQVSISPEGVPLHCVLLKSSGDPASDEAACIWIMARHFQPSDREVWGRVCVLWGAPPASTLNKPATP